MRKSDKIATTAFVTSALLLLAGWAHDRHWGDGVEGALLAIAVIGTIGGITYVIGLAMVP